MEYKGHFKDEKHDCDIIIKDKICTIDGIEFEVENLQWLSLYNNSNAEEAYKKFNIVKIGGEKTCYGGKVVNYPYAYILQRYSLYVEIPTTVIDIEDNSENSAMISFKVNRNDGNGKLVRICDNKEVYINKTTAEYFRLTVGNEVFDVDLFTGYYYVDDCGVYFETALKSVCKKIQYKYRLKCCFGCDYSDYNPYYDSDFGDMHCWREYPQLYKISKWKHNYDTGDNFQRIHYVAETDICNSFKVRESDTEGVRGKIYDY